jgi:CDP-glycerol glycerophosphotransferase (TagB/SpsB family)
MLLGRKLVLYAPTWRDYDRGSVGFSEQEIRELNILLQRNNAALAVRAHPKDKALLSHFCKHGMNVVDVGCEVVKDPGILLKRADVLVTDYSSIWVDYLLMDKPIVGYAFDYAKYKNDRGLMFDYEAIFPGDICYDFSSYYVCLEKILRNDSGIENPKAQWCKSLMHANTTPRMCSNVVDEVIALVSR